MHRREHKRRKLRRMHAQGSRMRLYHVHMRELKEGSYAAPCPFPFMHRRKEGKPHARTWKIKVRTHCNRGSACPGADAKGITVARPRWQAGKLNKLNCLPIDIEI